MSHGVDAFTKLTDEAPYQQYTKGGFISYVECPNMVDNVEAVLKIIQHIYETTMYAELNFELDYCCKCGAENMIRTHINEGGKINWRCNVCGNEDPYKMNVARRICGYMGGSNFMNQGRMAEFHNRDKNM